MKNAWKTLLSKIFTHCEKMSINTRYIDEISKIFNNKKELEHFLAACQMPLKKSIKINLHRISVNDFESITKPWWWKLTDPEFGNKSDIPNDSFYIDRDDTSTPLWRTFFHQSGLIYIQEIAASMSVKSLDTKEDSIILDVSSAPGWKSIQIWDFLLYRNRERPWFIVSNDVIWQRLKALSHNINRMWIYNSWMTMFNWFSFWKNLPDFFDEVLVDAPCSWEWTGFKSDSALKFWRREEINKIAGTQFQLLVSAIKATKPWWSVVYSTCTMNPYENEVNLKKIKEFFGDSIKLEDVIIANKSTWIPWLEWEEFLGQEDCEKVARFWPHIQKTWWFFIAKIRKLGSNIKQNLDDNKLAPINPFRMEQSKTFQTKIIELLYKDYWIKLDLNSYYFMASKEFVSVTSPKIIQLKNHINFEKIWIPIFKIDRDGTFRPMHGLGTIFGHMAKKNFVEFDEKTAQKYAELQDIELKEIIDWKFDENSWYIIIKWKNYWIWVWKIIKDFIKNKYIK